MSIAEILLILNAVGVLILAFTPLLKRLAAKTKTKADDEALELLNEVVRGARGLDDLGLGHADKVQLARLLARQVKARR